MKRISIVPVLGALLLVFSLTACKEKSTDLGVITPVQPTDPALPTPDVIDDSAGFNVKANPPKGANYYIHRKGDFDKLCVVATDETNYADKDIECILEVEELEGKFYGLEMVMNLPSSMCRYYTYAPYYYFGEQHGSADGAIFRVDLDASNTFVSQAVVSGSNVSITTSPSKFQCAFDHQPTNGPNCCYGNYTVRTYVNGVLTVTETRDWGGNPGNCVAGPGADQPRAKSSNLPMSTIKFVQDGDSERFTVKKSIDMENAYSIYYANYVVDVSVPPAAWQMSAPFPYTGNPYYQWTCLDDAGEIKARISLQVREWNEVEEFVLKAAGNPNTSGTEPDWITPINDWPDWENWVLAPYNNSFPGMPK